MDLLTLEVAEIFAFKVGISESLTANEFFSAVLKLEYGAITKILLLVALYVQLVKLAVAVPFTTRISFQMSLISAEPLDILFLFKKNVT